LELLIGLNFRGEKALALTLRKELVRVIPKGAYYFNGAFKHKEDPKKREG